MSRAGDIRMHVEHLFEGRTLTTETIELKEEVYGNLVARYEDYVAQGMSDDEAYRRTCDAVESLDDVLDGEKNEGQQASAAPASGPVAGAPTDPAADAEGHAVARRRWPTAAVVVVSVAAVLLVGIAVVTALGSVVMSAAVRTDYDASTTVDVQPLDTDDPATVGNGGQGTGTQNQNGKGNMGATGLDAEVRAHSVSELTAHGRARLGDGAVRAIAQGLPLASYLGGVSEDADAGAAVLTYTYQDRDRVAADDDCVDRALVYNVVALMSAVDGLDRVEVVEIEGDGRDYDRDRQVFDRASVEGVLGIPLGRQVLSDDPWNALRDQVMTKRYWDLIWERAEVD